MTQYHQDERRLTPRTKVDNIISVSVGHATPAFQAKTVEEEDTNHCMGQLYDVSDKGMCITTQDPLSEYYFVKIYIIQDSQYTAKDYYSGVITWCLYNNDKQRYRYGIEFLSTWIRRKTNRKYNKIQNIL